MGQRHPAPAGLRARGRVFWRDVTTTYDLDAAEVELLTEACRLLDQVEQLSEDTRRDGLIVAGAAGQPRAHPALRQLNADRALLARLLGQLDLEDEMGESMPTTTTVRARRAARARWTPAIVQPRTHGPA
jgi:hypothetical protein